MGHVQQICRVKQKIEKTSFMKNSSICILHWPPNVEKNYTFCSKNSNFSQKGVFKKFFHFLRILFFHFIHIYAKFPDLENLKKQLLFCDLDLNYKYGGKQQSSIFNGLIQGDVRKILQDKRFLKSSSKLSSSFSTSAIDPNLN